MAWNGWVGRFGGKNQVLDKASKKGLRNKRKAFWAKQRMAKLRAEQKAAEAAERAEREGSFGYED